MATDEKTKEEIERQELNLLYAFEQGVNLEGRIITLTGDVSKKMFKRVDSGMTELERRNYKTITIRLNSEGGDPGHALAIVGRIYRSPARIIIEGYGSIMSAALLILAAGDKRRISQFAWAMHHEDSYDLSGRHNEVKAAVSQRQREEDQWADAMAEFTYKDSFYWKTVGKGVDIYYSPQELLDLGVVDEVF